MIFGVRDVMISNYSSFLSPYRVVSKTHHFRSIQERDFQSLVVSDCVFFLNTVVMTELMGAIVVCMPEVARTSYHDMILRKAGSDDQGARQRCGVKEVKW